MDKINIHEGDWMKTIFSTGKWYLIASLFTKGIGIFLLPLYTTYLSPADYGLLSTINSIALLLPIVISCSLDSAFGRFFHDYKSDKEKLSVLFSTIFWFVLGFGFFSIFLVLATAKYWSSDLLSISPYPLLYLAFIPVLFLQLGRLGITYLEQSLRSRMTGLIQVIATVLKVIAIIPLIAYYLYGIKAVLIGNAIAAVTTFICITVIMYKSGILKWQFSKLILRESMLYSLPLIPGIATTWVNSMVDRIIIAKYDSFEGAGLYSFAFQIGLILYLVGDAATKVISPLGISSLLSNIEQSKKKFIATSLNLLVIMGIIACFGILFSEELVTILGSEQFKQSIVILPIVILPYIWSIQYRFFSNVISFYKQTRIFTIASIYSACVNLLLNVFLVPRIGFISGAISTIVSSLIYFFILYYYSQKLCPISYNKKRSFLVIFTCIAVTALSYMIYQLDINIFSLFMLKLASISIAGAFLLSLSTINIKRIVLWK